MALKYYNGSCPITFFMPQDQLDDRYPRPPWCLTVRVVGDYFLPGQEPPAACCVLKPPGLVCVKSHNIHCRAKKKRPLPNKKVKH